MTTFEKILSDNEKYNKCANNYELVSSLKSDYTEIYTKLRDNLPKYADHLLGSFSDLTKFFLLKNINETLNSISFEK